MMSSLAVPTEICGLPKILAARSVASHQLGWSPNSNSQARPHSSPYSIAVGADGNLWFTETVGNNIGRITPGGTITEFALPHANSQPKGIAAGPDGNLWFTELGRIGRISSAGTITEFPLPAGDTAFLITPGPKGDPHMWFTEQFSGAVGCVHT